MHKPVLLAAGIAFLVGAAAVYTLTNTTTDAPTIASETTASTQTHRGDGAVIDDDQHMGHMEHMGAMLVTSERAFIEGMIPHHQEAIDTATEVLERGGTTLAIQQLATDIIAAQTQEITAMEQWYRDWYNEPYQNTGDYQPMMRELENLAGADLDRTFLEDMIDHHMGAIMMARSVQPYVEHEEITTLTQNIMTTQSAEIRLMQQLLLEL